jgi:hypothetical protein
MRQARRRELSVRNNFPGYLVDETEEFPKLSFALAEQRRKEMNAIFDEQLLSMVRAPIIDL